MNSDSDLRKRASTVIDTEWHFSWYWDKHEVHWSVQAKSDCVKRICDTQKELQELKKILQELEPVASKYLPIETLFNCKIPNGFLDSVMTLNQFDEEKDHLDGHGYYCYDGNYTAVGDVFDITDPLRDIATHVYWIDK